MCMQQVHTMYMCVYACTNVHVHVHVRVAIV